LLLPFGLFPYLFLVQVWGIPPTFIGSDTPLVFVVANFHCHTRFDFDT
jgi:hypothetical protein